MLRQAVAVASSSIFLATIAHAQSPLIFNRDSGAYFDASVNQNLRPIQHAWNDFRRDFYKVMGSVLALQPSRPGQAQAWAGGSWFEFYMNTSMPAESFTVQAVQGQAFNHLAITGADVRGLMYGMYHVSGDIFGVDPFWWFYDLQPQYAGTITVPGNYSYWSGPPTFYARGAFINDEDISGFFFTDPVGDSVYSADVAYHYAETLLRLRVNNVIPSTFGYCDERHYRTYAERGMIVGQHHVTPVGVNTYAWPMGVPYTYRLNPEPLQWLWQNLANYQQNTAGREMIYSVGYRGLNDYPFWQDDVGCDTDQCRGETISNAMGNQSAFIRSTAVAAGVPPPRIATFLQMEMGPLFAAGYLTIPPNVSVIFSDFDSSFQIGQMDNVTAGDGFYAHLATMSGWPLGGQGGQLTEYTTLARAFANMWEMWVRNATSMGMINLSDIRQVPLTSEAVYKYLWNPAAFNATSGGCELQNGVQLFGNHARSSARRQGPRGPVGWWPMPSSMSAADGSLAAPCAAAVTPAGAQASFILDFATRHYSTPSNATSLPSAVAAIHQTYFNASYMQPVFPQGDHYFGTTLRGLMETYQADVSSNQHNQALNQAAQKLLDFSNRNLPYLSNLFNNQVLPLQQYIPTGQQSFFFASHVIAQVAIHYFHTVAFQAVGQSAAAWSNNDVPTAAANMTAALAALDTCLDFMRAGEGDGVWRGSYASETWTWVVGTRSRMSMLLASINGQQTVQPPADVYADAAFMAYECPSHDMTACNTFPLKGFNATFAWDVMVRVTCASDAPGRTAADRRDVKHKTAASTALGHARALRSAAAAISSTAGGCATTVMGVSYQGPSTSVALFTALSPLRGNVIPPILRYTLDGSPVQPTSAIYSAPFEVTVNGTVVKARAFDGTSGAALATESVAVITQTAA